MFPRFCSLVGQEHSYGLYQLWGAVKMKVGSQQRQETQKFIVRSTADAFRLTKPKLNSYMLLIVLESLRHRTNAI